MLGKILLKQIWHILRTYTILILISIMKLFTNIIYKTNF